MVRRKSDTSSRASIPRRAKSNTRVLVNKYRILDKNAGILKEIRYLRRTINLLIPKASFVRVVQQIIMSQVSSDKINRIQAKALEALHEAAEAYIVQFFEDCVLLSMHTKRITLMVQDVRLMRRLRGRTDILNR